MKRAQALVIILFINSGFDKVLPVQSSSETVLRTFAENYSPSKEKGEIYPSLPNIDSSVRKAIYSLDKASEKYLTLILLKLYHSQLKCCNQSYELRKNNAFQIDSLRDPLIYEFVKITNLYPLNTSREMLIHSGIGYEWVKKHPEILKYKPVGEAYLEIRKLSKERKIKVD